MRKPNYLTILLILIIFTYSCSIDDSKVVNPLDDSIWYTEDKRVDGTLVKLDLYKIMEISDGNGLLFIENYQKDDKGIPEDYYSYNLNNRFFIKFKTTTTDSIYKFKITAIGTAGSKSFNLVYPGSEDFNTIISSLGFSSFTGLEDKTNRSMKLTFYNDLGIKVKREVDINQSKYFIGADSQEKIEYGKCGNLYYLEYKNGSKIARTYMKRTYSPETESYRCEIVEIQGLTRGSNIIKFLSPNITEYYKKEMYLKLVRNLGFSSYTELESQDSSILKANQNGVAKEWILKY